MSKWQAFFIGFCACGAMFSGFVVPHAKYVSRAAGYAAAVDSVRAVESRSAPDTLYLDAFGRVYRRTK